MGSVGALSSVNTIVAALLGHFVLGEALSRLHLLALLLAIGGGVLTWSGASDPEVVGNTLAVLAGVSSGLSTICARKAGKASSLILGAHLVFRSFGFRIGERICLNRRTFEFES